MASLEHRLTIQAGSRSYPVLVGPAALEQAGAELRRTGLQGRVRIIADEQAWRLHGPRLSAGLHQGGYQVETRLFRGGEQSKRLETLSSLYDWLLEVGVERSDCLLAFGGGVCGDLVGFAAATILRGVPFVQVPTTLLAQVDAAIGGKTGINHPRGKNLIGAFHQPHLVLADTTVLATLDRRELAAGWAEVVKMAITLDGPFFEQLEANPSGLLEQQPDLVAHAIARSIQLKGEVVAEDERETELRMVLNYGHTIGHAVEVAGAYTRYLHGEAVSIGMAGVGRLAERLGLLPPDHRARQDALLAHLGLPLACPDLSRHEIAAAILQDKKAREGRLTWVLCHGIGQVGLHRDVPVEMVNQVLDELTATVS